MKQSKKKEQNKQSKTIYILVNIKVWCFQISKNYTAKDQAVNTKGYRIILLVF